MKTKRDSTLESPFQLTSPQTNASGQPTHVLSVFACPSCSFEIAHTGWPPHQLYALRMSTAIGDATCCRGSGDFDRDSCDRELSATAFSERNDTVIFERYRKPASIMNSPQWNDKAVSWPPPPNGELGNELEGSTDRTRRVCAYDISGQAEK